MAEVKNTPQSSGLFLNPQTDNVIGQAYNDLLFSQNERIKEEKQASESSAALDVAQSEAKSDRDKDLLKAMSDQAKAAEKQAEADRKEVSNALKEIDVIPGAMWGSYGAVAEQGAKYLRDNMPEIIEEYGIDQALLLTKQFNSYLNESQTGYKTSYAKGSKLLQNTGRRTTKGNIEAFGDENYLSAANFLNNPDRFIMDVADGAWRVKTDDNNLMSIRDLSKMSITEPDSLFKSMPVRSTFSTASEAWQRFPGKPAFKERSDMEDHINAQTESTDSDMQITAFTEYYMNSGESDEITQEDFYSSENGGAVRMREAIKEFREKWLTLYDNYMKKSSSSGSSSKSKKGRSFIETTTINPSDSEQSKEALIEAFSGSLSPIDPAALEQSGIKGLAVLQSDLSFDFGMYNSEKRRQFGVADDNIKIEGMAFDDGGDLFVAYNGMLTDLDPVRQSENDQLLLNLGLDPNKVFDEPERRQSTKVIEWGSNSWIELVRHIGNKKVGNSTTRRDNIREAFPDLTEDFEVDFYAGLIILANSTNETYYETIKKEISSAGGINADEFSEMIADVD